MPQAGPQGFAGQENSEPNLAEGASGLVTHNQPLVTPAADHEATVVFSKWKVLDF